ncbi:MAG: alpha-1,2-fucosyltransferase [Moorea sp. SIO2I5]|nr:alpha-1,2-fucosyltransferase [Moorena sp. SIO2I5]
MNKSNVIVRIKGGLGNQMFQYAFGRKIAYQTNKKLFIDISFYKNCINRKFELDNFCTIGSIAEDIDTYRLQLKGVFPRLLPSFTYRLKNILKRRHVLFWEEKENCPDHILHRWQKDIYLDGYWQGTSYFKSIEHLLRKEFQLAQPLTSESQEIKDKILSLPCPVSIHIRRGDYAKNANILSVHGLCSIDYYMNAIRLVQEHSSKTTFFLFSDDPGWVDKFIKPKIPNSINVSALYANRPNYEDMLLMSYCKHHIIANSTFSWWGAWLSSPSVNKLTIAPKRWFATQNPIDISSLIPNHWVII